MRFRHFVQLLCLIFVGFIATPLVSAQETSARIIKKDSTSVLVDFFVRDSSQSSPIGLTGLTNATSGLTCYYHRNTSNADVQISLVSMTLGTYTSGGWIAVNGSTMPGEYQLGVPNAAIQTGADSVMIMCKGAANMVPAIIPISLINFDLQSAIPTVNVQTNNDKTGYSLSGSQTFSTSGSVGSVTGGVIVTTNNDKSGYRIQGTKNTLDDLNDLTATEVWNVMLEKWPTVGSAGQYLDRIKHYVVNPWTLDVKTKRYTIKKDDGVSTYETGISSSTERTPSE